MATNTEEDKKNLEEPSTNDNNENDILAQNHQNQEDHTTLNKKNEIKYPYPKSIPFIIGNEFCERFNYYGMRTILVLYLTRKLGYTDDTATVTYHVWTMLVYFLCIFGAILSDSWLGKFRTIFYLSLVYVVGSVILSLGAIPTLNLPITVFTLIGLALTALGSGGIKPCVSAFGGDQFKLPEQVKQMTWFFSLFYFSINSGSLISTTLTPILRQDVNCFGERECYSLAFGVPAVLMIVSIVIFVLGKPLYKIKPPEGNMVVLVSKTISNAIATKWRESKTNPRASWLDYADKKHDRQLINDVRILLRVLLLFLPLPFFWALFDQQGSRWTLQATRMNGDMGSFDIKPDQIQLFNPLLILVFIPLYEIIFYPLLSLVGIRRPLQKLTLGGLLAGVSFLISGLVELELEKTYPQLPVDNFAQLRIYNPEFCTYTFQTNIPNLQTFNVGPNGYYENKNIPVPKKFTLQYTISSNDANCNSFSSAEKNLLDHRAYGLFLSSTNNEQIWFDDEVKKPSTDLLVRNLANIPKSSKITWKFKKSGRIIDINADERNLISIENGEYTILVNNVAVGDVEVKVGGVYTILISATGNSYSLKNFIVTEPNTLNILWIIPQYVIITLGEVMFSITGLEFSYSQAPPSMKSVLQACWLLTVAVGNVIVVIVAEAKIFESQAYEFFLFAGLMIVDMAIFTILAWYYKPVAALESTSENNENQIVDSKLEIKPLGTSKELQKEKA